jgi:hypothetical protein
MTWFQPGIDDHAIFGPLAKLVQWRQLGFYCHHDTQNREYRLVGSRAGLRGFADLIRAFVADPRNAANSEHEHYVRADGFDPPSAEDEIT